MKKVLPLFVTVICLLTGSAVSVIAYENLDYTLEGGVLTVHETTGFEGELILPIDEMGEVDKIIMEETSGSSSITALKLTAKDEIIVEKNAFFENENIKVLELKAGNKVKLGGEGWDWNDRFNFGCFESSGLEKAVIRTKELDMSEGWAFHECSSLTDFDAIAENYAIGENCFTDYYWNGTKQIFWIPWVENQTEDFVCLGDTIIAYKGDAEEVTIPPGKLSLDMFNGKYYIKKIIISDEITKIPQADLACLFSPLQSLEAVKMPAGITEIPNFCFWTNTALKHVWIGKNVTKIGRMVFPENSDATIHYEGTEEEWDNIALVSDGEVSNYYQQYLNTLENMSLHFNCVNTALNDNRIAMVNIIDDFPYKIEVKFEGEINTGVIFVALVESGYMKEVIAEKVDGYYQFSNGNLGDKIKVFWLDGKETLAPLCDSFELDLPENSVEAIYNEYTVRYTDFFNSFLLENVPAELLVEWIDYTRDLTLEWIEAEGKELTNESFEEALPEAMFNTLVTKRRYIKIREVLVDQYPDAILDLWENNIIHEDFYPWAEVVRALVFDN